ncbi:MAG: UDP-N-acetylmuramate--L-alanine ligase [Clostridia bacterium]|nr:UDP-N-acetylmuramate--L-alanine ligase [Clostridia bacterium]
MAIQNTHYGSESIRRMLLPCRRIFFIGIGGISMSALARISLLAGYGVGGSDQRESPLTRALREKNAEIFLGHDAAHLRGYDAVVYTVAISESNPEYLAARERGLPLISRADYLDYLMSDYPVRIGVAGMHGKSTCTAMCASILARGADPTVLCGAALPFFEDATYRVGNTRKHFLFEACEYMDSFLDFSPTLAVILNVEMDHVDYFHSMEQIRASFLAYAKKTGPEGCVLFNADDPETCLALRDFDGNRKSISLTDPNADFHARAIESHRYGTRFELYRGQTRLGTVELQVHGKHMVYNALAAAAVALLCEIPFEIIQEGLSAFEGAHRRMEFKGTLGGADVYDDYAHHPREIRATLAGAREMGYQRILCAYQPHTYSRTAGLWEEFVTAFDGVDRVFFADIYAAREQNQYGVSSQGLALAVGANATYLPTLDALAKRLREEARPGDLVLIMGAGDIDKIYGFLFP